MWGLVPLEQEVKAADPKTSELEVLIVQAAILAPDFNGIEIILAVAPQAEKIQKGGFRKVSVLFELGPRTIWRAIRVDSSPHLYIPARLEAEDFLLGPRHAGTREENYKSCEDKASCSSEVHNALPIA